MAIISINKKLFEKEISKLDENIQDKIAIFGTPIEKIDENEVQLEIFPNRPDMLPYQGFKRAFLGFLGKKRGIKKYKLQKPKKDYLVKVDSSVKNIRPYTACAIVKGLNLNEQKINEIIEMQEKLHLTFGRKRERFAIGIYPLDKIKIPITFKALEPDKIKFIPLGANKEMSGLEILQKHPIGKEYAHLLAGKEKFPIFIDSNGEILSMPPIINSKKIGEITPDTHDIFIECSGFDFLILNKCLNIIVTAVADMGGKIQQMRVHGDKKRILPDLTPEKMKINLQNVNKLLGLQLKEKNLKNLLEKMGYNYKKGTVEVPAWRVDVLHEVDLIEDVAIAYGYDNFVPEIPKVSTIGQENPKEIIKRKISEILNGLKMIEVSNYHLITEKDISKIEIKNKKEFIEVKDSKTDYKILRPNLTFCLLKVLSENIDVGFPQNIFEIGKVFFLKNEKITERESLAVAITGNFTEIRQILEHLFRMTSLTIKIKEPESEIPKHFIDGRTIEITLNQNSMKKESKEKSIGFLGEIHPKILKNWKIKTPVSLFEISLEEILQELADYQR